VAVVVIVAVIVVIALIYVGVSHRGGGGPVQPVGTVPQPGQVKEGQPYGKAIPPGAPPFMKKQFGGQ
jgi:hypothetical protein